MKGVIDDSGQNLPDHLQGDEITPEVSGIYSQTFADDKFGVSLSASYQERNSGFNQASVGNGWRPFAGDENNWGTIPQPGQPGSENITNRPDATDTYSVPQNLGYGVNGIERKRTNGQLALQWRPVDSLTATLDYTYSENKIQTERNELSVWFNFGPSASTWTRRSGGGPARLHRADPRREQRPVDGRRQVRHQEREQIDRLQPGVGSLRSSRLPARLPRLER